jgi:hypothetical protein
LIECLTETLFGKPFFLSRIQLCAFIRKSRSSEALELLRERSFDGLTAICKTSFRYHLIQLLEQLAVDSHGDFGFGHATAPGMTIYHTKSTACNQFAAPVIRRIRMLRPIRIKSPEPGFGAIDRQDPGAPRDAHKD